MKKLPLFIALAFILLYAPIQSQDWTENLPGDKIDTGEEFTFHEIQKAFNDYWEPLNVENGYYIKDGIKRKAYGWKQFRRWEWFWGNRVDPITGAFPRTSAAEVRQQMRKTSGIRNADGKWMSLGPTTTSGGYAGIGRLNCIAFIDGVADTYYVGSPSGGLWKTTDDGVTWTVLTDENDALGVSDILVYPSIVPGSETIYIATGDRDGGSLHSLGGDQFHDNNTIGVLKSTDGGSTWSTTDLTWIPSDKKTVNRLLKHPGDSDSIYATGTDGVFLTTDGGASWPKLAGTFEFIDMEFKPMDPGILYGSTRAGKVYKSGDKGVSWSLKLDVAGAKRVELAVSEDEPGWVYAVIVNSVSGLESIHKSEDDGETWVKVHDGTISGHNFLGSKCDGTSTGGQGTYDLCIAADPSDADIVYIGGINTWKSSDGGSSWTISNMWKPDPCGAPVVHADKHNLVFQPGTGDLFECNDGGLYKTSSGSSWTHLGSGLVISQLYRLGVSQLTSNNVIAGLQDNGTKSLLSGTWKDVIGGDGMECLIDYTDDDIQYGEYIYGILYGTDDGWSSKTLISSALTGFGAWVTPISIDPVAHETIYQARDTVWKSTDKGTTWAKISAFDAGGTFRSFAVAPSDPDTMYVATKTKLWATYDGGTSWSEKTGSLPTGSSNITYISVNSDFADTLWVALGEFNSHGVYQSTDAGATWTSISSGLPSIPVMSVIQNRQNTSEIELYAATDVGVYVKVGSADWALYSEGLPSVVVTEVEIYYDDTSPNRSRIRAATYGRGLWESELYSPAGAPIADFDADETTPLVDSAVVFTDISNNDPTSWAWTFTPSTVTYLNSTSATSQNPEVSFDAAGDYDVELTATNAFGSDTETKVDYITVVAPHKWVGATSTDWSTTTNWDLGTTPDESIHVIIESGATFYPELTSGHVHIGGSAGTYNCKSLTIKSGGLMTVGSAGAASTDMVVYGNLKVESGGTLKLSDDISIESGGKLYVTGGTVENYLNFGGWGDILFKSGSGGYMSSGSITIYSDVKLWGGDWYASGGTFHCGGSGSAVVIEADDPNMTFFDFTIDKDVLAYVSTSSSSPLSISGDFTQEVGSMFSVSGGETLLVSGDALLKSDATGAASLINFGTLTISGTSTVERYISDAKWHLLASPVSGETAASLYFGGSPEAWLKKYSEPTNTWEFITSLSTPLTPGRGFAYWIEDAKAPRSDKTISFDGPLLSTDLTLTTFDYTPDTDHGYNIVGNPFPSAIDWDVGSWDTTDINGAIWVWEDGGSGDGTGTYLFRNSFGAGSLTDGIIPMAQGFFIQVNDPSPSLTIPADARIHSTTPYYKNADKESELDFAYAVFEVSIDGKKDEVWVIFTEQGSAGYDNGWDVNKLFSFEDFPQLYLEENGYKLSIDALPTLGEETRVVNLNFEPNGSGEHSLMLKNINDLDNAEIMLEDLLTGNLHDLLKESIYTFYAYDIDDPNRFVVHFNPLATGIEDQASNIFSIYSLEKNIYIKSNDHSDNASVFITDIMGRQIANDLSLSSNLTRIPVNVSNSYLVVRIIDGEQVITKKLFVR